MSGDNLNRKRKIPIMLVIDILIVVIFTWLAVLGYKFRVERLNALKNTPDIPALSENATHFLEGFKK